MKSRLLPWPVLVGIGLVWTLGLWLALFPTHAQTSWLRLMGADQFVQSPLALRLIGLLWVGFLTFVLWFNSRHYR